METAPPRLHDGAFAINFQKQEYVRKNNDVRQGSYAAQRSTYIDPAAGIVAAYVTKNAVPVAELPSLIGIVHAALSKAVGNTTEQLQEELRPAVPIKKSVTPDFLIS